MTDKQIIIDGCDVSGCSYHYKHTRVCLVKMDAAGRYYNCADWHDCDFKKLSQKLKRKEQECKELKDKLDCCFCNPIIGLDDTENFKKCVETAECFRRQLDAYKMEAEEGKEINAELRAMQKDLTFENQKFCYQIEELTKHCAALQATIKELEKLHEGDKGLITATGKMNYQLLQEYDKLKQENELFRTCHDNEQAKRRKLEQTIDEIKQITEHSILLNCYQCPMEDNCEELCNKENNFQQIISQKVKEAQDEVTLGN